MNTETVLTHPTMSSLEIATMVKAKHHIVIQAIDRLAASKIISKHLAIGIKSNENVIDRIFILGQEDSYIMAAYLAPEFTPQMVDEWNLKQGNIPMPQNLGGALMQACANLPSDALIAEKATALISIRIKSAAKAKVTRAAKMAVTA